MSFAPAGSVESLQSKAGVLSPVVTLSAGETRFGVVGATLLTCTDARFRVGEGAVLVDRDGDVVVVAPSA